MIEECFVNVMGDRLTWPDDQGRLWMTPRGLKIMDYMGGRMAVMHCEPGDVVVGTVNGKGLHPAIFLARIFGKDVSNDVVGHYFFLNDKLVRPRGFREFAPVGVISRAPRDE